MHLTVWLAVTLLNVYAVTVPTEVPSTVTAAIAEPLVGVMVKLWLPPALTLTVLKGAIEPPVPPS